MLTYNEYEQIPEIIFKVRKQDLKKVKAFLNQKKVVIPCEEEGSKNKCLLHITKLRGNLYRTDRIEWLNDK